MAYDGIGDAMEVMRLEKEVKELRKFRKFVEHICSHSDFKKGDKPQRMEDWVVCKICNKTFSEIVGKE